MKATGFTLVELVVTIGILSIMAAVAAPRFFQASTFQSRGFYDKSAAVIRLAQKTAVAWRATAAAGTLVYVCVTANQIKAGTASGCATALTYPVNGASAVELAPSGVTLNPVEISFDGLGRPSAGATIIFTSSIAGDPARQITIAAETGYVSAN
jgi:MSHA pilin protein MshC